MHLCVFTLRLEPFALRHKGFFMLLCIDIGNTNIVLGAVDQDRVIRQWRMRTIKDATVDEIGTKTMAHEDHKRCHS